jgi:hypothetical protein
LLPQPLWAVLLLGGALEFCSYNFVNPQLHTNCKGV